MCFMDSNSNSADAVYDVVVIGCGLVGATVANLLGQYQLRTLVLERDTGLYPSPRAIVFDDEVLRVLQDVGIGTQLAALTAPLERARYINGAGRTLVDIPLKEVVTVSGHPMVNAFYQPEMEELLRGTLECHPTVTLRTGQEVQAFAQDAEAVHLTVRDLAREQTWTVRARYVLGCDGARSFTRKTLGIGLQDFHQDAAWLVVDAEAVRADPFPMWNYQVCHPARPTTFVHGRGKHLRWEFKLRRDETPEEVLRPERLRALIHRAPRVGIDPELITIQRSAVYTFHATIAERWQQGRVFLLGDAAHQMPPFLGQGACAGMRDAMNLTWKLQMVIQGQAPASLLASYEVERRPHVQTIIQRVITFGSVIQTTNWMQAWLRDRVMQLQSLLGRSMVPEGGFSPPLRDGILAAVPPGMSKSRNAKAAHGRGSLLLQRPVTLPDRRIVPLDEVLGQGFALVAYDCNPLHAVPVETLTRFTQLGGRVVYIAPSQASADPSLPDGVRDHTGALQQWFASHSMQVVLVRPDRYVFGGSPLTELPALMQQLLARLLAHAEVAV
jgi:3-(3-hydroxy-phenyl)propionate hydroxylase